LASREAPRTDDWRFPEQTISSRNGAQPDALFRNTLPRKEQIMAAVRRLTVPTLALLLTLMLGLVLGEVRSAHSYPDKSPAPMRWEYTTMTIDVGELPARLNDLGREGWDVFSLERAGLFLDQAAEGKTRLVTDTLQLTAKRPLKP
jgi:hypothetical protein